jgi:hypothetical protein
VPPIIGDAHRYPPDKRKGIGSWLSFPAANSNWRAFLATCQILAIISELRVEEGDRDTSKERTAITSNTPVNNQNCIKLISTLTTRLLDSATGFVPTRSNTLSITHAGARSLIKPTRTCLADRSCVEGVIRSLIAFVLLLAALPAALAFTLTLRCIRRLGRRVLLGRGGPLRLLALLRGCRLLWWGFVLLCGCRL